MIHSIAMMALFAGFSAFALPLSSPGDLASALQSGEIDNNDYSVLATLASERPPFCSALSELRRIPDLSDEEFAFLDSVCAGGRADTSLFPSGLCRKLAPFVSFSAPHPGSLSAEYRLRQGYDTSGTALTGGHAFALQMRTRRLSAESRLAADGFGNGRFRRNSIRVRETGFLSELQLGNCVFRPGEGVTLGGAPMVANDFPETQPLQKSFLSPDSRESFGATALTQTGSLLPFAFLYADPDRSPRQGRNRTAGAGLAFEREHGRAGFLLLNTALNGTDGSVYRYIRCGGLFAAYRPPGLRSGAELSLSDSGYAVSAECIRRSREIDAGLSFQRYSKGYFNPAGRGASFFYGRIRSDSGSATEPRFYGLRNDEQGIHAFVRVKSGRAWVRPWITAAESGFFRESFVRGGLLERLPFSGIPVTLEFAQKAGLHRTPDDSTFSAAFSGAAESRVTARASLSGFAEAGRPGPGIRELRARVRADFPLPSRLSFAFGGAGLRRSNSGTITRTFGLFAEQRLQWSGGGLSASLFFSGPGRGFTPSSLCLEVSHAAF